MGFNESDGIAEVLSQSVPGLNCGTVAGGDFLQQRLGGKSYTVSSVTDKIFVVYFHVIRRNDGTGGLTTSQVDQVLTNLQTGLDQASICIVEKGRSFIDNSTFFSGDPSTNFNSIVSTNPQTDAINVYLLPTTATAFGRAKDVPSNALVLSGSYVSTQVASHEFGHCLGLFHTHRGTVFEIGGGPTQCPELVNGSNSSTCGDYVTDTPADPAVWIGCTYVGTGTDANGDTYSPLTDNIMSYAAPNCLTDFTPSQVARMHTAIDNSSVLQNAMIRITGASLICTSESYTITSLPAGASISSWNVSPSGAVSLSGSGNSRTLTKSGSYSGEVTLTVNVNTDCGSVELERVIWVGVPDRPIYYDEMGDTVFHIATCVDLHHNVLMRTEMHHSVILEWDWELITGNFNVQDLGGGFGTVIGFQPSTGVFSVRVRNACGWSLPTLFTV